MNDTYVVQYGERAIHFGRNVPLDQALSVVESLADFEARQEHRRWLRTVEYHHKFSPYTLRCDCGLRDVDYHAVRPDDREVCPLHGRR